MNESSHWYDPETGEARHTIVGANGKERNTTLRDARKYGWLPSCTTILKVLASPELDRWKGQQILLASLTLPKKEGEPDDEYVSRIMEDAFKQVENAADLGTRVHKSLEEFFQGRPYDEELSPFVLAVKKWVEDNRIIFFAHELRLVSRKLGYAGTTDAIIGGGPYGRSVLDYKTRKSRPEYPMTPWQKEPMQIAAYAHIEECTGGCNLYVSTTEPGRVEAVWYDSNRLQQEMDAFKAAVKLWQHLNKYVPESVIG